MICVFQNVQHESFAFFKPQREHIAFSKMHHELIAFFKMQYEHLAISKYNMNTL